MSLLNSNLITLRFGNDFFESYINFEKLPKTIGIKSNHGMTARININNIQVSPRTYWKKGNYCQMNGGRDANCWLCNWYGTAYDDNNCNCKPYFKLNEHLNNIKVARKNKIIAVVRSYCKEFLNIAEAIDLEKVNDIYIQYIKVDKYLQPYTIFSFFENRSLLFAPKGEYEAAYVKHKNTIIKHLNKIT